MRYIRSFVTIEAFWMIYPIWCIKLKRKISPGALSRGVVVGQQDPKKDNLKVSRTPALKAEKEKPSQTLTVYPRKGARAKLDPLLIDLFNFLKLKLNSAF